MRALVSASSRRLQRRQHHPSRPVLPQRRPPLYGTRRRDWPSSPPPPAREPLWPAAATLGARRTQQPPALASRRPPSRPAARQLRLARLWPTCPRRAQRSARLSLRRRLLGSRPRSRLASAGPCGDGAAPGMVALKMLPLRLLLVALALCCFQGDAKFGESGGAKRRRCLNGSSPRRLKKRDRRLLLLEPPLGAELACRGFYPRLSCCPRPESQGLLQLSDNKVGARRGLGGGRGRERRQAGGIGRRPLTWAGPGCLGTCRCFPRSAPGGSGNRGRGVSWAPWARESRQVRGLRRELGLCPGSSREGLDSGQRLRGRKKGLTPANGRSWIADWDAKKKGALTLDHFLPALAQAR